MAKIIQIRRSDGNLSEMWYSDFRSGGKRIRHALSIYRPKAQKMLEDMLALRRVQRHGGAVENMSWFTFRQLWLKIRKEGKNAKTYLHDELAVRRLEMAFPSLQSLKQITPEFLEDARVRWRKMDIGEYAIAKHLRVLKKMMRDAKNMNLAAGYDWRSVSVKKDRKRNVYYTIDEVKKLLTRCKGHWRTAGWLMARAGMRPAEVRHLEWGDIDFKSRTIAVRIKEHLNWKPKKSTDDSPHERLIDMPEDLEAHLQSLPKHTRFVLGNELVKEHTYKQYFIRIAEKAKVGGFAYVFRHSYASHLISSGSTLPEVGTLLGHEDHRSTQIYSHLLPHARRTAVDRLPKI